MKTAKRARRGASCGAPRAATPPAPALLHARRLVAACTARHQHSAAAWYADNAVALSGGAPADVLLLAEAHYRGGACARAHRALEQHGLLDAARFPPRANSGSGAAADGAVRSLGFGATGTSAAAAAAAAVAAPPMVCGAVAPEALPFFYLGALALYSDNRAEAALGLLETAMEGPGQQGLRTPLHLPPESSHAHLAHLARTAVGIVAEHTVRTGDGVGSGLKRAAAAAATPSADARPIGGGAPQEPQSHSAEPHVQSGGVQSHSWPHASHLMTTSCTMSSPCGVGASCFAGVEAEEEGSAEGEHSGSGSGRSHYSQVWRTLHAMALQHSPFAVAAAAAAATASLATTGGGGAMPFMPTLSDIALLHPSGDACIRGVPLGALLYGSTNTTHASASHLIPVSDGSVLNLVSAMASLRGNVLLKCDNTRRATQWFLAALRIDPYNVSAQQVRAECVCLFRGTPPLSRSHDPSSHHTLTPPRRR